MVQYIIRLDDACPMMNHGNWEKMENLLDWYHVKPIVGVIPDNKDSDFHWEENLDFYTHVSGWQSKGWTIALHGKNHILHTAERKYYQKSHSIRTEFAGVDLEKQKEMIGEGIEILKKHGIRIALLVSEFGNRTEKIIVIPWSDGAALEIDKNLNRLSVFCVVPNMNNEEGRIAELMNKQAQFSYCRELGIPMLDTMTIDDLSEKPDDMAYPVILKPVESVEGNKLDIRICENESEYRTAMKELAAKGYVRVLLQPYLKDRKEYVLTGAISRDRFSYIVAHHLRQWPVHMGCGSYSILETSPVILNYGTELLEKIQRSGFTGVIDIEFLMGKDNRMFLNEINWRSSGRNYVSLYTGVFSVYQYYCDILNDKYDNPLKNDKEAYCMNETTDIRQVLAGNISLMQWLRDLRKVKCFAVWYRGDPKPFFADIMYYVTKSPLYIRNGSFTWTEDCK